ncbi:TetR/AcrR family transcriptional regulator [Clostridium sp. MSJ-4]|uniref:TetR/AcrR family transcriptional regulator n=1 Tax=Clostridium simiarum TaxID=2841506 RepID=A0ABS6F3A8_9CLOT|nr:TetR/AcrR family transcriptional regulator [Clostridium simiarum]MBU5592986.1 TetR/AcrR family transcriptional regulator [Clostridium simiarum]
MINKIVTSKEAILAVCRELAAEHGLQSLNMRKVAEKCNVSVGSVYNYFPSKADLIAATIQDVWQSIFNMEKICKQSVTFPEYVTWIFESVQVGVAEYPNFFTAHSVSFASSDKGKARQVMMEYFGHIKAGMLDALQNDHKVKPVAFSEAFTQIAFVDFVFSSLLALLMKKESSCTMLTEIIKRSIY